MRMKITLAEFKVLFKGLGSPDELFEMLRMNIRKQVGRYFTELMLTELIGFLGRERYERHQKPSKTTVTAPMSAASTVRGLERLQQRYKVIVLGHIKPRFFLVAAGTRRVLRKT